MWRNKLEPKGGTASVLQPGNPQTVDLTNNVQNSFIVVDVTCDVTVSVAGTGIRNEGSLLADLTVSVQEGGFKTWNNAPASMLRYLSECLAAEELAATRLTSAQATTPGTYALREMFVINFDNPFSVKPRETSYLEAASGQRFQLEFLLGATPAATIVAGGTVTVGNYTVRVYQMYATSQPGLPAFKPFAKLQVENITSASTQYRSRIETPNRLRGIVVQQTTNVGTVDDIINSLVLKSDAMDIYGPNPVPFSILRDLNSKDYSGINSDSPGYLFVDFIKYGRNSEAWYPQVQGPNPRFEFDCQPSAAAGATDSLIKILMLEYARPVAIGGKNVVDPVEPDYATI